MTPVSEHSGRGQGHQTSARVVEQSEREEGIVRAGEAPITHEAPEDWGWHGEAGKWGRIGGWLMVLVVLAFLIGNHDGQVENLWIVGFALYLAGLLVWDARRRKNAWRSR
ncbi:DUF2631 domain-containing protein [Modestobacter sp. SYSU DS0511]